MSMAPALRLTFLFRKSHRIDQRKTHTSYGQQRASVIFLRLQLRYFEPHKDAILSIVLHSRCIQVVLTRKEQESYEDLTVLMWLCAAYLSPSHSVCGLQAATFCLSHGLWKVHPTVIAIGPVSKCQTFRHILLPPKRRYGFSSCPREDTMEL